LLLFAFTFDSDCFKSESDTDSESNNLLSNIYGSKNADKYISLRVCSSGSAENDTNCKEVSKKLKNWTPNVHITTRRLCQANHNDLKETDLVDINCPKDSFADAGRQGCHLGSGFTKETLAIQAYKVFLLNNHSFS
jgi:hypothetical protein